MGQFATKPKHTKSSQRLEEKTKETELSPIRVVDNAATKPKDNKYPHWHWLEEKANKLDCLFSQMSTELGSSLAEDSLQ